MKKGCPSLVRGNQDPNGKRLSARNTNDHDARGMHNKHYELDDEHNAKSYVGVETAIKTRSCIKVMMTPRAATLWVEVNPNVPSAAAWSAHLLPRLPM